MKIISVTNRLLCKNNFLEQIEKICQALPHVIILREKDLCDDEYEKLSLPCKKICDKYNVPLFINTKYNIAKKLNIQNVQLSFKDFSNNLELVKEFKNVAVSVHSVNEAVQAQNNGATFIIAGHVFETDCKKGLAPRGVEFIKSIVAQVKVPVFAIGGISSKNISLLKDTGICGVCLMSSLMTAQEPKKIIKSLN